MNRVGAEEAEELRTRKTSSQIDYFAFSCFSTVSFSNSIMLTIKSAPMTCGPKIPNSSILLSIRRHAIQHHVRASQAPAPFPSIAAVGTCAAFVAAVAVTGCVSTACAATASRAACARFLSRRSFLIASTRANSLGRSQETKAKVVLHRFVPENWRLPEGVMLSGGGFGMLNLRLVVDWFDGV